MKAIKEFPYDTEERTLRIPMPDGAQLAARIWISKSARKQPVPAIFEYIPYRQNDSTAPRDTIMHTYFSGHGYVQSACPFDRPLIKESTELEKKKRKDESDEV